MDNVRIRFRIGQRVHHKMFDYRGVIVDVDAKFQGSEEWYETVAQSHPPKDRPWYHVLVHDTFRFTYVADRNLEPDLTSAAINHPSIDDFFADFSNGVYVVKQQN